MESVEYMMTEFSIWPELYHKVVFFKIGKTCASAFQNVKIEDLAIKWTLVVSVTFLNLIFVHHIVSNQRTKATLVSGVTRRRPFWRLLKLFLLARWLTDGKLRFQIHPSHSALFFYVSKSWARDSEERAKKKERKRNAARKSWANTLA